MCRSPVVIASSCVWLVGCVAAHENHDACAIATEMRDDALAQAMRDAPACQSDEDCVVFSARVYCAGIVTLTDCGFTAHREVARRYADMNVNDAVCHAVAGADLGCWQGPACSAGGPPACDAGQCVRAPL